MVMQLTPNSSKYDRWIPMVYFSTLILMSSLVGYFLAHSYQQFLTYHQQLSQQTAARVSHELETYFTHQQQLASLMLKAYAPVFNDWIDQPENASKRYALSEIIKQYFPNHYSFTLANEDGSPIWDDLGESIGEVCLLELKDHSLQTYPSKPVSYIHPGPKQYHFDLFITIKQHNTKKIMLISFKPDHVAQTLADRQALGHKLFLVRNDLPYMIEINDQGSRDMMTRAHQFTTEEQTLINSPLSAKFTVNNTDWQLIDMTDHHLLNEAKQTLFIEMTGLMLLVSVLMFIKWRLMIRRTEERQERESLLINMNATLEQKVHERTIQLEQQQSQLRLAARVFSNSSEGILITNAHNEILDVNDALIAISGYKRPELIC